MACNVLRVRSWGNNGTGICGSGLRPDVDYYLDGSPTVIGTLVYSNSPCTPSNFANIGYYSYESLGVTYWFYVDEDPITGYLQITLTGQCATCTIGIVNVTTPVTYYDCCGNFINVKSLPAGSTLEFNPSLPYTGPILSIASTSSVCPSSTPTPTPTLTPNPTPSVTRTPTVTPSQTQTPTASITPSNSPITRPVNECIPNVIFPMELECRVIQQPSTPFSSDGVLEVLMIGGTSPYSVYWQNGTRTAINSGLPGGSYSVTVVDYYGDYTGTTTCTLTQPVQSCTIVGTASKVIASPTPTKTPTLTPTQTSTPTLTPTQTSTSTSTPTPSITPSHPPTFIKWIYYGFDSNVAAAASQIRTFSLSGTTGDIVHLKGDLISPVYLTGSSIVNANSFSENSPTTIYFDVIMTSQTTTFEASLLVSGGSNQVGFKGFDLEIINTSYNSTIINSPKGWFYLSALPSLLSTPKGSVAFGSNVLYANSGDSCSNYSQDRIYSYTGVSATFSTGFGKISNLAIGDKIYDDYVNGIPLVGGNNWITLKMCGTNNLSPAYLANKYVFQVDNNGTILDIGICP